MAAADDDHDELLSFDEILSNHDVFVGSEATDYGEHLQNIHSIIDELWTFTFVSDKKFRFDLWFITKTNPK